MTENYITQAQMVGPVQVERSQELQTKIKTYSTIACSSKNKISYRIEEKKFQNAELQILATYSNTAYIEQINEELLLISGLDQEQDNKKFIKYEQGNIQHYQMKNGRYCHRTIFNNKYLYFIISGIDENVNLIEKCEVYNLQSNTFTNIKDIPDPYDSFGCSFIPELVLTFGGEFDTICKDKIQSYNPNQNYWEELQHKIPKQGLVCSAYLKEFNSCLVYSYEFESQMFDLKSISRHGEVFKGQLWVFTNAINSNNAVYQFDFSTVLYFYELNNAKWEKIE